MEALIRNTPSLDAACTAAQAGGILALDTEFVWMRTYSPILGIVQMADADGNCHAIDCLLGTNPASLGKLIADGHITKILHDARQDLEHLRHYTGVCPQNVFDTQLAAAFAGFPGGIGLQKLLAEAINVNLPKTETRTDWTQRPLTDAQVDYALDDVRYLDELRLKLLANADELGTRAWLEEELQRYNDPALYADLAPDDAWKKVKCGRIRLDGAGRARLQAIAAVRETKAREWNLPKTWLSDDQSLAEIAERPIKGGTPRFRHRLKNNGQRDTLSAFYAEALAQSADLPEEDWPADNHVRYLPEVQEAADNALVWLREKAATIHVDATTIASRATVTAFLDNPEDDTNPLAHGWRLETVGRELAALFAVD